MSISLSFLPECSALDTAMSLEIGRIKYNSGQFADSQPISEKNYAFDSLS